MIIDRHFYCFPSKTTRTNNSGSHMNPVFDRQSASGRDAAVVTRGDVNLNAQSNQKLTSSRNDGIDGAVAKEPAKVKKN
jgi:hypothetical protein